MRTLFSAIQEIAANGLASQYIKPTDYYDDDGFLVCGKCGEHRQAMHEFSNPTSDNPGRKTALKVAVECRCEREQRKMERMEEILNKKMKVVASLKKASLMDARFANATFDQFVETKENEKNLKLCKRYVSVFDQMIQRSQGLLMWGSVGTGKSYAAACIANALMERRIPVVMTSFVRLLELFRSDKGEDDFMSKLNQTQLVIFDDLGAERDTGYAIEKVYNIIDSRYRSGLPMIFTTNLTISEMKDEADVRYSRIYDRIFEVCYPMQFTGTSWRKKAAKERFTQMEALLLGEE